MTPTDRPAQAAPSPHGEEDFEAYRARKLAEAHATGLGALQAAFGRVMGLPGPATVEQINGTVRAARRHARRQGTIAAVRAAAPLRKAHPRQQARPRQPSVRRARRSSEAIAGSDDGDPEGEPPAQAAPAIPGESSRASGGAA